MTNIAKTADVLAWYANFFKAWQAKLEGDKPTAEMLTAIHGLGCRPGKQALAAAMTLRASGVTASQIVIVCGAPQNNKRTGLITDGLLKRVPMPATAEGHTVYKCEVTAKGQKRIDGSVKREADLDARGAAEPVKTVKPATPAKPAVKQAGKVKGASKAKGATKAAPKANAAQQAPLSLGAGIDSLTV